MDVMAPKDEGSRVAALAACGVMDTPREAAFDNVVFTVAQLFRVPMALLSLVDSERVWSKASVGPIARQMKRSEALCQFVIETDQLVIIEDATLDARFAQLASVIGEPYIRFFAGAPLYGPGRQVIGALCVMDRHPRTVPERQQMQLLQLALEAGELLRLRVPDLDLTR